MTSIDIGLAPFATVYFGDGRPSVAGETDMAKGLFPPTPRTLQGAFRTRLLDDVGLQARAAEFVGPSANLPAGWAIRGPWLAEWTETAGDSGEVVCLERVQTWYAAPGFLLRPRSPGGLPQCLTPIRMDRGSQARGPDWDLQGTTAVVAPEAARFEPWTGYLSAATMSSLVRGRWPRDARFGELPSFVKLETRPGIAIDPATNRVQPGMLYARRHYRFGPASGFAGHFEGQLSEPLRSSALTAGACHLGGRARLVSLHEIRDWHHSVAALSSGAHLSELADAEDACVWLILTTPAFLKDPARPNLSVSHAGGALASVLAAAIAETRSLGGFSFEKRTSGPSRRYVMPGTCWLVQLRGGTPSDRLQILTGLHDAIAVGDDVADAGFGFGHTFVAQAAKELVEDS
ncbi:MAG: hypothetical protein HY303_11215 [Candidatus Wallbacteria bacterium]|nr:hypothetical protein [Candidatus Wallbacteria bacterium]